MRVYFYSLCLNFLVVLDLVCEGVRLIREKGFRQDTAYYHLGDGSHAYHFNAESMNAIYFKCVFYEKLRCHGRAILKLPGRFTHSKAHNHPPDADFVGQRHFRENVLQQCRGAQFVSYDDILNQERRDRRYTRRVRSKMTMRRLRTSMSNARMKSFPPIPHTLIDLSRLLLQPQHKHISSTVDGEDNLYAGSVTATDGSHHVAFFSQRMINFMSGVKIIQSDGTFRARPNLPHSAQCFILVTPWRNAAIPLGWILMERKSLPAYRAVLQLLKVLCPNLNPDVIVTDWEYSQQKAWEEEFPNAEIQGCLWHLCRAFIRKANKMRLLRYKVAIPNIMKYIKQTCAIALLPIRYFYVGLGVVKDAAREEDIIAAYLLRSFFDYVENQWLRNRVRRKWMTFFNSMHRTNNICESHNKSLRRAVGAYRPNVYAFIQALAKLEHNTDLDIELMKNGGAAKRGRRWQSVYTDRAVAALSDDLLHEVFNNRNETVSNFINHASNLFNGAFNYHVDNENGGQQ